MKDHTDFTVPIIQAFIGRMAQAAEKKLREVGLALARPTIKLGPEADDELAALGIRPRGTPDERSAGFELEVMECNADAVDVFRYARADYLIGGLSAAIYHGLSGVEIKAIAEILERKCDENLLWRMRVLESAFGKEKNRQQEKRSRK